jgi:hypothetical protein
VSGSGKGPAHSYTVDAQKVTDAATGLAWQGAVANQQFNQADAAEYCQGLSLGGFATGWRLPKRLELESLVKRTDSRSSDPMIDLNAFPAASPRIFWTATQSNETPPSAWVIDFRDGVSTPRGTSDVALARCVH